MSHRIITMARQFGSGGHGVTQRLSDLLGIPLYDRSPVGTATEKMGHFPVSVEEVDESALSASLANYQIPKEPNSVTGYGLPLDDSTHVTQTIVVEALAREDPYVIVGRCGDHVPRNYPGLVDVFICASMDDRVRRIMECYDFTEKDVVNAIESTNRRRKNYYESYTKHKWGGIDSHQMLLNISRLGMDKIIQIIKGTYESD